MDGTWHFPVKKKSTGLKHTNIALFTHKVDLTMKVEWQRLGRWRSRDYGEKVKDYIRDSQYESGQWYVYLNIYVRVNSTTQYTNSNILG